MDVLELVVFASVAACATVVAVMLARTVSARMIQSRQERLKAHLDWVNPMPQTSRKRGFMRR